MPYDLPPYRQGPIHVHQLRRAFWLRARTWFVYTNCGELRGDFE